MTTLISKYIVPVETDNKAINFITNNMVYPAISMFCEIPVYYETGMKKADGVYKFSYGNWNEQFEPEVFFNGSDTALKNKNEQGDSFYNIDFKHGTLTFTDLIDVQAGDNVQCVYNFAWFTPEMLAGFIVRSVATINYVGNGAVTSYTIDNLPTGFWGISADLCIAMCMENLILGYTMWVGKLIFAISPNELYDGNDSVISQLETIKRNCEERAYKAIENPQMRSPHRLSKPTDAYWRSITMGSGVRVGPHGQVGYGKTRGIKYNRMVGHSGGSDLGL